MQYLVKIIVQIKSILKKDLFIYTLFLSKKKKFEILRLYLTLKWFTSNPNIFCEIYYYIICIIFQK